MKFPKAAEILDAHDALISRYGGEPGTPRPGSVESAVYRCEWGPFEHNGDMAERAALLLRGICDDHPFVDGNKRTAFTAAEMFLQMNGSYLDIQTEEVVEFMLRVAADEGLTLEEIRTWIHEHLANL